MMADISMIKRVKAKAPRKRKGFRSKTKEKDTKYNSTITFQKEKDFSSYTISLKNKACLLLIAIC